MFQGLGGWHLVVILFIILLLFGAPKLPGLAKSLGQSMRILKKEVRTDQDGAGAKGAADAADQAGDEGSAKNESAASADGAANTNSAANTDSDSNRRNDGEKS